MRHDTIYPRDIFLNRKDDCITTTRSKYCTFYIKFLKNVNKILQKYRNIYKKKKKQIIVFSCIIIYANVILCS